MGLSLFLPLQKGKPIVITGASSRPKAQIGKPLGERVHAVDTNSGVPKRTVNFRSL